MDIQTIPVGCLQPHPANSNVMPERLLSKLATHIEKSGCYPPLVVRPVGTGDDRAYQILDGHHRLEVLKRIGHVEARCVVWRVDDDEALLLLATLNRLQGKDDAHKRGELVAQLRMRMSFKELADRLPERAAELEKLAGLRDPPRPRAPVPIGEMPQAVHFFLLPDQARRLDRCLRAFGGPRDKALMRLVAVCEGAVEGCNQGPIAEPTGLHGEG
jgi:hypothetical protein